MPRHKTLATAGGVLTLLALLALTAIIVSIRTGLQDISDLATARFPGTHRTAALIQLADSEDFPLKHRNRAVWALGQTVEQQALPTLNKHYDGRACTHATRLCQHELQKAIRMIESHQQRSGPLTRLVAGLHQPWR
jgi:hypothetical protein